jgi:hypothetical protein
MREVNRAAVVAGIVMAVALTLAQARDGGAMTSGLAWGSQKVAQGAQIVVAGVSRVVRGVLGESYAQGAEAPASVRVQGPDGADQQVADFVWRGTVDPGQTLEIEGLNGAIIAERASGTEIEVRAEKRARRSDPDEVRIEVVEHGNGVTVCAVYPSSRNRENSCGTTSGGRNGVRDNDVEVTFLVSVPEGVELLASTVNGDVEVHDLASDVNARSVNGDIEISTTGFAEASTVNGSIDATMEQYDIREGLSFSTVNGSISLDLPDDVDADVDARWVNGHLDSELPISLQGRVSRRSAEGILGEGGPELSLRTVNGSIRLF